MENPYETAGVQIKCSDEVMRSGPSQEAFNNLNRKLLELGRNGFIVEPLSAEGYWSGNSRGTYYSTILVFERGRRDELDKLNVTTCTWC